MTERNHYPSESTYTYPDAPEVPDTSRGGRGRLAWILILGGVFLLLAWAGIKGFRIYQSTQGLLALQTEAETLLAGGLTSVDPEKTVELVSSARADIGTLNRELAFVGPLAPVVGRLPQVGPLAVAAPHLLAMAEAGSEAGALAVEALAPALVIVQQDSFGASQIGELLPIFQTAAPQLEEAAQALDRYSVARAELDEAIDAEELPWRVRQLLTLADEWVPAGKAGLKLVPQLPLLLGMNGPRRYLIMAQNEDELRPTGGFLTGAGVLTIENGRILDLSLKDANGVDNWREKPYAFPPQPYYDFMLAEMFLFRDANFWADFPTSARQAMDLYAYGQDESALNGTIAIDQEFLRLLVDSTGPIDIGDGRAINSGNLIRTLQQARDPEEGQEIGDWVGDRKAFLAGFAGAIQSRLESDFSSIDPVRLARNMITALDERHLQVYMDDQATAEVLSQAGWDGSLSQAPPGDFWMVVDTNMGFNKVNLLIDRSFDYSVDLRNPATPNAQLTVVYSHGGQPTDESCYQGVESEFEEGADYLALADKCYWNYVRVYAPTGSVLVDSSRHTVPGDTLFSSQTWDSTAQPIDDPGDLATFANFILVKQGETAELWLDYGLPNGVIEPQADGSSVYELHVQKQAGTRQESLRINLTLPEGAEILAISPTTGTRSGNLVTFDTLLTANTVFRIHFR